MRRRYLMHRQMFDRGTVRSVGEAATRPSSVVIRPDFDAVARPFHTITDDQWEAAWEVPMRTVIAEMQAAFHRDASRIVVVIPTTAMSGGSCYSHVAAAAESIRLLVKSAARQWGAHGITVNAVAVSPEEFLDTAEVAGPTSLAPPALSSSDPAALIAFLCSDAAGDVTGQTIVVDGGVWM
jgi:NAD(P)-dependent dehydrogenase (short-subunit alcohol dehydrogenase family)